MAEATRSQRQRGSMKDMQAHLARIRSDAAECLLLSTLTTSDKRDMFGKMAEHLNHLALEIEKTMAANGANMARAADDPDAVAVNLPARDNQPAVAVDLSSADNQVAAAADLAAIHDKSATPSRRLLPWVLVVVAGLVAGTFFWANEHFEKYSALFDESAKREPHPAPRNDARNDARQEIAALVAGERAERQVITERLGALVARLDNIERALDNLKRASAETVEPSKKEAADTGGKYAATEAKASPPEDGISRRDENSPSTLQDPAAAKPPDGAPPTSGSPPIGPVERVGAIGVPAGSEPDQRGPTVGPHGCTHFRSFDAASGMYTTFDGRRRPCR